MAKTTIQHDIGIVWVRVADPGQAIWLQVIDGEQIHYAYGPVAPVADAIGHEVSLRDSLTHELTAPLWIRAVGGVARVAVTTSSDLVTFTGGAVTSSYTLHYTWTKIADAGGRVQVEWVTGQEAVLAYSTAAPDPESKRGHKLWSPGGDEYIDEISDQSIWARSISDDITRTVTIVVSTGGLVSGIGTGTPVAPTPTTGALWMESIVAP